MNKTTEQTTYKTKEEAQDDPRANDEEYIRYFKIDEEGKRIYGFRKISEIPYMYHRDART